MHTRIVRKLVGKEVDQKVIYAGKAAIDQRLAVRIVMESAVPMSKIDLANA